MQLIANLLNTFKSFIHHTHNDSIILDLMTRALASNMCVEMALTSLYRY